MSVATDATGLLFDALTEFAGLKGNAALQGAFSWASGLSQTLDEEYQEDPVGTSAQLLAGLVAVTVLGPTATAAAMTEVIAGYLGGGAVMEAAAGAITSYMLSKGGESLYAGTQATMKSVVNALGGTMTVATTSTTSTGNIAVSQAAPANFEIVSPDALGDGSYNQILINLPTLGQDSNAVTVITAPNTSITAPSSSSSTNPTPSDAYTGSTITFTGNNGQQQTGVVLYRAAAGDYVLDPNAPGYMATGLLAVGSANVISITPPSQTSGQPLQVITDQSSVNGSGGLAISSAAFTNGSSQGDTDNYNSSGQLSSSTQINSDGSSTQTTYSLSSNSEWVSQTSIYNSNNQLIGTTTLNTDGTTDLTQIDPATGDTYSITFDAEGKPVSGSASSNMTYSGFVSAVIDTLATQLISQVLIKNDIPASIVASAFASATIKSAVTGSTGNFNTDFANSVVDIAGGLAGSDIGALIAKSLGVSSEAGAIVGGVGGNLLTQAIVNKALDAAGLPELTDVGFDSSAGEIVAQFEVGLEAAGAGALGSYLGSLIAGNSLDANLGGAVGGAAGFYLGSFLPGIGNIIGAFVGSFIGDLLGGLFDPPRGPPFVQAGVGISGGQFATLEVTQDNNGNLNDGYAIGASLTTFLNQVLANIGGTVTGSAEWNIGYGDNNGIFSLQMGGWPPSAAQKFGSINDAIAYAAYHLLRSAQIVGGNPIMMWELETSPATNINDLLTDMGIAQNYQLYSASPLAVDVAIAASGDPTQYQNLQNQLASAQNLGLSRLSYDGTTLTINTNAGLIGSDLGVLSHMPGTLYTFAFADMAANMVATLNTLQALAAGGHLTSIRFTDATTPTLAFSAVQMAGNINALNAITGAYLLNVTDTAANVAANLNMLQTFAAGGHLHSLVLTDVGTPTMTLSAAQLTADATTLAEITSGYKVIVQDTSANISANFATLQAMQAAGHIQSITATDSSDPVLGISCAQYAQGAATLALMTTPYLFSAVDTSANVGANLAALQTLVSSGKLVSVKFTDATPSLSVTVAQTTSYASLIALMAGSVTITVSGIAANTSYTFNNNGLTLPLAVGVTIQSNGTNSFSDTLSGSNLLVTLANSKAVVDASGNATFTTPLAGFGSSTLRQGTGGTAIFTVGSDNLTFNSNALHAVTYANGAFSFAVVASSSAYTENVTWNPTTGAANLVVTAAGGQPVITSLGQVNPGTVFLVSGSTITNTNSSNQLLLSTTVNADGSQADTVYNFSGGTNKDTVTTLNAVGQQTSVHWDHTDGSSYTTYYNPVTQAVIANLTLNANGSGSVGTANNQTITFAAGNVVSVSIGNSGDTLLTIKTLSGTGIVETIDLSSGQIVTTVNGNDPVYTLANASASIDASGNLTLTGGGSTLLLPANGANATFTVGQDKLSFPQNALQTVSSLNGTYMFGLLSPAAAAGFSETISWNPVTGIASLIMSPAVGKPTTTSLGPINTGSVLSVSGSTVSITASNGTVVASATINSDGSLLNTFNNSAGALHTAANGIANFVDGSDQLTFQPGTLQSYTSTSGIFNFVLTPQSSAYTETLSWNPANGMASLILTATGGQPVTTTLGQVNPGTVFNVTGTTITNTNSSGQKLYATTINNDGSQVDAVYNYSGSTSATITTLNKAGQQTSVQWNNTNGSQYTSYYNPSTQAVIANFSVNANGSGYVATNNNQTINFAAGNNASVSIGSTGDTLLMIKTLSGTGITETLDMSSGKIVSTINGNIFTYTLANAGASIDASGNVTITGGGSTIVLPSNGSNATFTVGQDSLSFPQNALSSLSSVNNNYVFAVASSVTGYSESISWNPTNGMASLILTPTAGGSSITTSIGQINPGNVLSISGPYITIAGSNGAAISSTTVNSDGSQINTFYNNSPTVNETVTSTNAAGQVTSIRYDNANGSTYTSYYNPTTNTIITNRSVNADGSGYVATANNQTVNFASGNLFDLSIDSSGNTLLKSDSLSGNGAAESLYLASGQITSTINGQSLIYSLASPAISYDSSGNLTLTAAGSTLVLPANGSNYTFTVGQDTISLAPASVTSITPNGSSYNFNLKPVGTASEYVTWNPQTGVATLNITPSGGSLTSTTLGYINPGYVLNVTNSLITNTNASGVVINSYAVQSNGSVIATASSTTYTLANASSTLGLASSDTVTISGSGDSVFASPNDTLTISGANNSISASTSDTITISGQGDTVAISDTAANLVSHMATLQTLAAGGKLASVKATDGGTLTLTVAQALSDATALGKLTGVYQVNIVDIVANIKANLTALTHLFTGAYKLTISDTAANISANLSVLQNITTTIPASSITVMDKGTIEVTSSQSSLYATVLAKITGANEIVIVEPAGTFDDFYTASTDTIAVGSSTITLGTGMNATLSGSSDTVNLVASDTLTVTSSSKGGNIINLTGSGGTTVTDSATAKDTVNISGNGVSGTDNNIYISSGSVVFQSGARADMHGNSNTITAVTSDTVGVYGTGNTATIGTGSSAWVGTGGGNVVTAGNGDYVNVSGNGQAGTADKITLSSGTAALQTGANATFYGAANTITVAQNDTVTIASGNATLIAGTGGDVFTNAGGSGNTYELSSGFGADTITNAGTGSTVANGTIAFLAGLTDENLWFQKSGNNLLIDQLGTSNQLTLTNWYSSANADVSKFTAGGLTLDSQIAQLVQAMATYATATPAFNPLTATAMPTNTALQAEITTAWHH